MVHQTQEHQTTQNDCKMGIYIYKNKSKKELKHFYH